MSHCTVPTQQESSVHGYQPHGNTEPLGSSEICKMSQNLPQKYWMFSSSYRICKWWLNSTSKVLRMFVRYSQRRCKLAFLCHGTEWAKHAFPLPSDDRIPISEWAVIMAIWNRRMPPTGSMTASIVNRAHEAPSLALRSRALYPHTQTLDWWQDCLLPGGL